MARKGRLQWYVPAAYGQTLLVGPSPDNQIFAELIPSSALRPSAADDNVSSLSEPIGVWVERIIGQFQLFTAGQPVNEFPLLALRITTGIVVEESPSDTGERYAMETVDDLAAVGVAHPASAAFTSRDSADDQFLWQRLVRSPPQDLSSFELIEHPWWTSLDLRVGRYLEYPENLLFVVQHLGQGTDPVCSVVPHLRVLVRVTS